MSETEKAAPAAKAKAPAVRRKVVKAAPAPVAAPVAVAAEIFPPSKPVAEASVSHVETTPASTPIPTIKQTVTFMTAFPTPPFKGYEELAAFGKANMEALVQANSILVKGFEALSKEILALTEASMETAATTTKAVLAAKTIKDVVTLQSDFTKTSFDKFVANSSKLSELGVKVAADAIAPVTARVNVAVEKVLKPAA
jgi:phasin family protein